MVLMNLQAAIQQVGGAFAAADAPAVSSVRDAPKPLDLAAVSMRDANMLDCVHACLATATSCLHIRAGSSDSKCWNLCRHLPHMMQLMHPLLTHNCIRCCSNTAFNASTAGESPPVWHFMFWCLLQNEILKAALASTGLVAVIASEEDDEPVRTLCF